MGLIMPVRGRQESPTAPYEIQEEVELYARDHGRHATIRFVPIVWGESGCWLVRFTLRSNDPAMRAWQEGRAPEPPCEDVWLHRPKPEGGYENLDIMQLGASGVRAFLERGNTWSGRGQFRSLDEQVREAREANNAMRRARKDEQKQKARDRALDQRRTRLKIPFLAVGIDLLKRKGRQPKETA